MRRILKYTAPMQRGEDVAALQRALSARGFAPGAADGIFGARTEAAVRAFQASAGLETDGIAGPLTLSALGLWEQEPEPSAQGGLISAFIAYLKAQVGHIYVWGAQGEIVTDTAWIQRKENSANNAARAIALYERRRREGMQPIRAYDCSGLLMRFLMERGVFSYDMAARHIYAKCDPLEREQLEPGDLVFRHNGVRIYHVGVCVGAGQVVESKGRDDGVVLRDLAASGYRYWNRFGRLKQLMG